MQKGSARAGTKKGDGAKNARPLPPSTLSPPSSPPLKRTGPACTRCRWRAGRPESRPAWPVKSGDARNSVSVGRVAGLARALSPARAARTRAPRRASGVAGDGGRRRRVRGAPSLQASHLHHFQRLLRHRGVRERGAGVHGVCRRGRTGKKGAGRRRLGQQKIESELCFRLGSHSCFSRVLRFPSSPALRGPSIKTPPHMEARRAGAVLALLLAAAVAEVRERGINGAVCFRMRLSARRPGPAGPATPRARPATHCNVASTLTRTDGGRS